MPINKILDEVTELLENLVG